VASDLATEEDVTPMVLAGEGVFCVIDTTGAGELARHARVFAILGTATCFIMVWERL
jgi:hypothetical protein